MKKLIVSLLLASVLLVGCGTTKTTTVEDEQLFNQFEIVEKQKKP